MMRAIPACILCSLGLAFLMPWLAQSKALEAPISIAVLEPAFVITLLLGDAFDIDVFTNAAGTAYGWFMLLSVFSVVLLWCLILALLSNGLARMLRVVRSRQRLSSP